MAKVINCDDGVVIRGETDDELVTNARAHIRDAHPELDGTMTREQILGMAKEEAAAG